MGRRSFTKPEIERIKLALRQGKSLRAVAEAEGRLPEVVSDGLYRHTGKRARYYQAESKHARLCAVRVRVAEGKTRQAIGKELGLGSGTVSRILIDDGRRMRSQLVGDAKRARAARIVAAWEAGQVGRDIAKREGCSISCVNRAIREGGHIRAKGHGRRRTA